MLSQKKTLKLERYFFKLTIIVSLQLPCGIYSILLVALKKEMMLDEKFRLKFFFLSFSIWSVGSLLGLWMIKNKLTQP